MPIVEHSEGREFMIDPPMLRVVRGEPTPEELAVVTALVSAARNDGDGQPAAVVRGRWNEPGARLRPALRPGPGAWRDALLR